MLQEIREALGPVGGLPCHPRGHRSRDQEELSFDGGPHPPGLPLDHDVEPADRLLEAPHHGELRDPPVPVFLEGNDLAHAVMMRPPSDTAPAAQLRLRDADRVHRRQPLPNREPGRPGVS